MHCCWCGKWPCDVTFRGAPASDSVRRDARSWGPMKTVKDVMRTAWRRRRMKAFRLLMHLPSGGSVIDLGGTPEIWDLIDIPLRITLLNIPEEINRWPKAVQNRFTVVAGDARAAKMFADGSFDVVFSNSLIEHLPPAHLVEFAHTVRRLAPAWWVQTPSPYFPIEAHCNLPFWWFYPVAVRERCLRRWERLGHSFLSEQRSTTQVLTRHQLRSLLPESKIFTEAVLGLPKSYSAFRAYPG